MPNRGIERGRAPRDRPEVEYPKHRGHQRTEQPDTDQPEGTVDQIRQALGPGTGEDVENERRHERADRQRNQQGMKRMALRTSQHRTSHTPWIPHREAS
jgi:hypothetical protein